MKTTTILILLAISSSVSAGNSNDFPISQFTGGSRDYNPNGAGGYEIWQDGQVTETLEQDGAGGFERRIQGRTVETIRPQPNGGWRGTQQ